MRTVTVEQSINPTSLGYNYMVVGLENATTPAIRVILSQKNVDELIEQENTKVVIKMKVD